MSARFSGPPPDASVLIPSWNNLGYLKVCLAALERHSSLKLQLIVIINDGSDGTLAWVQDNTTYDYVHASGNIGICYGLNAARPLVQADHLIYLNDDMIVLPGWDTALKAEIDQIGHDAFFLSATMIEPMDTGNACVVVKDFGRNPEAFREAELLRQLQDLTRVDWMGATWPPSVVSVRLWDLVGGLSPEFSPGMYSDPDFSMKLHQAGVRYFKGVGRSLVYHFGSASTGRIRHNNGKRTFLLKWGRSSRRFTRGVLRMGEPFSGPVGECPSAGWINRLKRIIASWKA